MHGCDADIGGDCSIFAFHGYPSAVASLLFNRGSGIGQSRIKILGYIEEGCV